MSILKVNNIVDFKIKLQVLKVFAWDGNIYYIVGIVKENTPWCNMDKRVLAVLNVDGSHDSIPVEAQQKADVIIQNENLDKL